LSRSRETKREDVGAGDGMRADARKNRDQILTVARKALAADPEASLNSVAKAARVGAGTLYRHFPDRESLVLAVYHQEINDLAVLASTLLVRHAPMEAFRLWCDRLIQFGRMKNGVANVIDAAKSAHGFTDAYAPLLGAVKELMAACKTAGEILPDSNAEDFLLLVGVIWRLLASPSGDQRMKRILALVFRGLSVR
jgi:AcrR family transcriptional regulator